MIVESVEQETDFAFRGELGGDPGGELSGRLSGGHDHEPREQHPAEPDLLTMDCPRCRKLYSVNRAQIDRNLAPLRFQCINESCRIRFVATIEADFLAETQSLRLLTTETSPSVPEGPVVRMPIRMAVERAPLSPNAVIRNQPLYQSSNQSQPADLDFTIEHPSKAIMSNPALEGEWETVLADYENQAAHGRFISACERVGQLQFAAKKYARILSVSPNEEVAKTMRARVIALVSYCAETRGRAEPPWEFRVPAMNNFILVGGSILLVMGLMMPHVRNLAGLGFAAVLLGLGIRFFLKPPPLF